MIAAGSAGASCPTGPDALNTGVVVRYSNGMVSTFRGGDQDGVVVEEVVYNAPDAEVDADIFRMLHGIHELEAISMKDGVPLAERVTRRSFDGDAADLPRLSAGLVWMGSAQMTFGAEAPVTSEISVRVGDPQRVGFGACTYDSLSVLVRESDPQSEGLLVFDWLPDLGIALWRGYSEQGLTPEVFTPVSIDAAM